MTTPAVQLVADKSTPYATGDQIKVTVTVPAGSRDIFKDVVGTISLDFPDAGLSGSMPYTLHQNTGQKVQPVITDSTGKTWTVQSDGDTTLVLTATA